MACILEDGKLTLTGDVGDFGFGDHFSHAAVIIALAQMDDGDPLTIFLNSGGGYVDQGAAIHALLSRRSGTTDIVIDGIAASSASLIAMAGDTVTMSAGSVMMIHDPAQFTFGNSDQHAKTIEELEAFAVAFARVYAAKSGKTVDECRAFMKATKWLAPEEAVSEGFADATSEQPSKPVAAFDYRAYGHAPQKLTALAKRKNWSMPEARKHGATASNDSQEKEPPMGDKPTGGNASDNAAAIASAVQADRERRKSIMSLDETRGREDLAAYFADETDDPVEKVKAALARAPKAGKVDAQQNGTTPTASAAEHERRRLNGEGLNMPDGATAQKGDRGVLGAAVARTNKRR